MAIATSSWTTTANTNWITSTGWVSSDPSFRLNQQLSSWVTGIGNTSIINIQATPNDATSRSGGDGVTWILQTRDGDTGSDWGIIFHPRRADTSSSASTNQGSALAPTGHSYYQRTPGTSNNGYGSYTQIGFDGNDAEDLTNNGRAFTVYETLGDTPWFIYSWERLDLGQRIIRAMFRVSTDDIESGSYYPGAGISKWICLTMGNAYGNIRVPIRDVGVPQKGLFLSGLKNFQYPIPSSSANAAGYFYKPYSQYGDVHYLGKILPLLISNTSTGVWGDTISLNSVTYTCLGNYYSSFPADIWIKTAE